MGQGSRLKADKLRAARAAQRRAARAASDLAAAPGLTFLQRNKVRGPTQKAFDRRLGDFLAWAGARELEELSTGRLDALLADYLDRLYWDGELVGAASSLLAAIHHWRPCLGKARHGALPQARTALAGFRARTHSHSLAPLGRPWVLCVIGLALLEADLEFAGATWLAWDACLRLPSDLLSLTGAALVGPGRAALPQWALLLYPDELARASKTRGHDEGVMLLDEVWKSGGSAFLERIKKRAPGPKKLWRFGAQQYVARFLDLLHRVPEAPPCIPYQVRHGSASHASAIDGMDLVTLQHRLRHTTTTSTLRYSKHVRYLAELEKVPPEVEQWGEYVRVHLGEVLAGRGALHAPRWTRTKTASWC